MTTIIPFQSTGAITNAGAVDPFEVAFAPAKPVLDALIELRKPLAWIHRQRKSGRPLFEPARAAELFELIPDGSRLADAGALIGLAEEQPAPEAWLHVVIGLMLQADAAAVDSDAYRCAVADSLYRDPDVWGRYEPGVSAAVIVKTIREARLQGAPTPGAFVLLCLKHRRLFKAARNQIRDLMEVRYQCEDTLEEQGLLQLIYDDDSGDYRFIPKPCPE